MKPLSVGKIVNLPEQYHYTSWAELKASNTRMADVVSAAVLWRKAQNHWDDCDCEICTLIRAVDKYARSE
jgi:hypothetical protein